MQAFALPGIVQIFATEKIKNDSSNKENQRIG
jgi:hypothetical protein